MRPAMASAWVLTMWPSHCELAVGVEVLRGLSSDCVPLCCQYSLIRQRTVRTLPRRCPSVLWLSPVASSPSGSGHLVTPQPTEHPPLTSRNNLPVMQAPADTCRRMSYSSNNAIQRHEDEYQPDELEEYTGQRSASRMHEVQPSAGPISGCTGLIMCCDDTCAHGHAHALSPCSPGDIDMNDTTQSQESAQNTSVS